MKRIVVVLLSLLSFSSVLFAEIREPSKIVEKNDTSEVHETVIIANNSAVDFSSFPSLADHDYEIKNVGFTMLEVGAPKLLISDHKFTDEKMAEYKLLQKDLPFLLVIAAFSDEKDATPEMTAEIFSGRKGDKLLYLYISKSALDTDVEEIAMHFSEGAQSWFSDQDMMEIPKLIQQQNRVEIGLLAPKFKGGDK